jgi:Transglutaminase-like superfamily
VTPTAGLDGIPTVVVGFRRSFELGLPNGQSAPPSGGADAHLARAMELIPFAVQASSPCPTHADLALALAAEFRPPAPAAGPALDLLSAPLATMRHEAPAEQLAACADVAATRLHRSDLDWSGIQDLLLDRVVLGGCGHPLTLAVACVEAARRAGITLGIVAGGTGCFVAHPGLGEPLLIDVADGGRLVDAGGRTEDVGWQCSHQVAARILNRIDERAERTGNIAWSLRAAELRLQLPFARPVLDELRQRLAHLRARLN